LGGAIEQAFGTGKIGEEHIRLSVLLDNVVTILLQTFLSVSEVWMNVIQMQLASTLLGVMTVCATLGSLEMDCHAKVDKQFGFEMLSLY